MKSTYSVLRLFGITHRFRGCRIAEEAVNIVIKNENSLNNITCEVYSVIAKELNCTWHAVERNLRTIILHAWKENKSLLIEIAGYPIDSPPTASEFIEILVNLLNNKKKLKEMDDTRNRCLNSE